VTSISEESLVIQREKLRKQLQEQRKFIAQQFSSEKKGNNSYPRSVTMRFLIKRPVLVSRLVTELAILLTGTRHFKLLSVLLALVKISHPSVIGAQKRLPASCVVNSESDSA
jgi:hypothetical protein